MLNVRLAGDHLYGKLLLTWLSPRGVLDEILNLIESVSEGFPSYSYYSSIRDKFRGINSVCRCRRNIAAQIWKITMES